MKRALITGVTGQDGAYLARFLLDKGYEVYGAFRRLSTPNLWRLQALSIHNRVKLISMDISDMSSVTEGLSIAQPDEVYNLAAQSFVGTSFEQPLATGEVTGIAVARMLEAVRLVAKDARFYQASTSELFGDSSRAPRNENSPFTPQSPYAAAKLYGFWVTRIYREAYHIYACNGILFNHESPLRGLEFVTRKVSNACARISLGLQDKVALGNLEARRDWGYAPDYVESMWKMLQQDMPSDYVIASGKSHTVQDFVDRAFARVRLNPKEHVVVDKRLMRPLEVESLEGDPAKAAKELGWRPRTSFDDLVKIMVDEDVRRWASWKKGELLVWDAPLYPEDSNIIVSRYSLDR